MQCHKFGDNAQFAARAYGIYQYSKIGNKTDQAQVVLGPSQTTARIASQSPIVSTGNHCRVESIEPDPAIVAARHAMAFDYGKFDYVLHEGRPVLLDVNKTTGAAARRDASLEEERRRRAVGIHAFLDDSARASGALA